MKTWWSFAWIHFSISNSWKHVYHIQALYPAKHVYHNFWMKTWWYFASYTSPLPCKTPIKLPFHSKFSGTKTDSTIETSLNCWWFYLCFRIPNRWFYLWDWWIKVLIEDYSWLILPTSLYFIPFARQKYMPNLLNKWEKGIII